ncbi:transposable element Tcb2 transposase [Trichonephila clavipes]|nr:transposable element Tcb2 transposase [Trichonephila clavipes]
MVWGAIAYNTWSPLVLIRGTMTAQWYVHDILQPHVFPLMQRFPRAIFQQNKARPHTARVSQGCLRTVTTLPWPARSPDLFPIEHIWDSLGWRIGHPSSLNKLEARHFKKNKIELGAEVVVCSLRKPKFAAGGCGNPVVKVSDHGRHVISSIPVPSQIRGLKCRPRHLTMVQNYDVRHQKPSRC